MCCLLALDSVTSTSQWIRQPKPRDDVHVHVHVHDDAEEAASASRGGQCIVIECAGAGGEGGRLFKAAKTMRSMVGETGRATPA